MKMLATIKLSEHKFKTAEGYLICKDAILSRTGKQQYMRSEVFPEQESDEIIDVDRFAKDVFDEKTMSSFENKPICIEHPDEDVGPENYADLAVGHVFNIHRGKAEGKDVMMGDLMITDTTAIEDIENGVRTDLSCGYDCDVVDDGKGNYYQTNIRGNHIALCEQGRAGVARIQDSWGIRAIRDSIGKGTLIQEFGKQGKQYKIEKITGNVIYAESLESGKTVLFKKDEENIEWAVISKDLVKDAAPKDFYGTVEGSEEADNLLFGLQGIYGHSEYSYDDFREMSVSAQDLIKAKEFAKEHNKFTYFSDSNVELYVATIETDKPWRNTLVELEDKINNKTKYKATSYDMTTVGETQPRKLDIYFATSEKEMKEFVKKLIDESGKKADEKLTYNIVLCDHLSKTVDTAIKDAVLECLPEEIRKLYFKWGWYNINVDEVHNILIKNGWKMAKQSVTDFSTIYSKDGIKIEVHSVAGTFRSSINIIDSINDKAVDAKRNHPNDYSDLFTEQELKDFIASLDNRTDAIGKSDKIRKKRIFVNKEKRDEFVSRLPDEAEVRIDEFDHEFDDNRYLVYWEVYYWGNDAVKDSLPEKFDNYSLMIWKERLVKDPMNGTYGISNWTASNTHEWEDKDTTYETKEEAIKRAQDILVAARANNKLKENEYLTIDVYGNTKEGCWLVDSLNNLDLEELTPEVRKLMVKDAWYYTENGIQYNGKIEDVDFEELVLRMKKRCESINTVRLAPNGKILTIVIHAHGTIDEPEDLYADIIEENEDETEQKRIFLKDFDTYEDLIKGLEHWRKEYLRNIIKKERTNDIAPLDSRIVNTIHDILGNEVVIDFGGRGQNIIIRYNDKVSAYMAKANLQRLMKALEKLGIKVDERMTEKNSNSYYIEIWHNSNLSWGDIRQWQDSDEEMKNKFNEKAIKHLERTLHSLNEEDENDDLEKAKEEIKNSLKKEIKEQIEAYKNK